MTRFNRWPIALSLILVWNTTGCAVKPSSEYCISRKQSVILRSRCVSNLTFQLVMRGRTLLRLAHHEEAKTDFTRAIEIDSNLALAYWSRGQTRQRLGKSDLAQQGHDKGWTRVSILPILSWDAGWSAI